uniref:Uncharacterized protein n=1 Tax=Sphaerodactylus townsendi TaxID=933632 RepID=A0ACB8FTJ1_9SAUR
MQERISEWRPRGEGSCRSFLLLVSTAATSSSFPRSGGGRKEKTAAEVPTPWGQSWRTGLYRGASLPTSPSQPGLSQIPVTTWRMPCLGFRRGGSRCLPPVRSTTQNPSWRSTGHLAATGWENSSSVHPPLGGPVLGHGKWVGWQPWPNWKALVLYSLASLREQSFAPRTVSTHPLAGSLCSKALSFFDFFFFFFESWKKTFPSLLDGRKPISIEGLGGHLRPCMRWSLRPPSWILAFSGAVGRRSLLSASCRRCPRWALELQDASTRDSGRHSCCAGPKQINGTGSQIFLWVVPAGLPCPAPCP